VRSVLVTGGSRGLGLAIARKLAAEGYRVIAVARNRNKELTSAMQAAERTRPESFYFVPFDLGRIDDISSFVQQVRKRFGSIYGLVNNAAISCDGLLSLMQDSHLERLVRINTLSPIVLTKWMVRSMMADGGGRVVNIASTIGFTGYSGLAAYAATKASLLGLTRSLAREVGRVGVTVNSVAPGFLATDMTRNLTAEQQAQVVRRSPLRRLAEVDDVANAVEFLLSDRAKNITGTVLTVDAGSTA
jgi:3-oxoacyl-[acyl-carrier protein] reductase